MTELQHIHVPVNGTTLHVVTAGSGFPIVLIHGFPQSWFEWRHLIPYLAESYRVIVPDLRGMGDSAIATSGQDKKTLASDVASLINALDFPRAIVVGHDWGGAIAQRIAFDYPEIVSALICINMPYFAVVPELSQTTWPAEQLKHSWYIFFNQTEKLPEAVAEHAAEAYLRWFIEHGRSKDSPAVSETEIGEYVRWFCNPERAKAAFNLYRSWTDQDVKDWSEVRQRVLNLPVLWIHGMDDPFVVPFYLDSLNDLIPDVRIQRFEHCGHWVPEEQPDKLSQTIRKFLGELKSL